MSQEPEDIRSFVDEVEKLGHRWVTEVEVAPEVFHDRLAYLVTRAVRILSDDDRKLLANALYVRAEDWQERETEAAITAGVLRDGLTRLNEPAG